MKQYSRVTYEQRCQIQALLQTSTPIFTIAQIVNLHRSTVYRELKRNIKVISAYKHVYDAAHAHRLSIKKFKTCRRRSKIQGNILPFVQNALRARWSPEQIAGRINFEKMEQLSHETIYRYIRNNPSYKMFLLHTGHRYPPRGNSVGVKRPHWAQSIHERPQSCNQRELLGDWERDTMFALDRKAVLVCTDRKSRLTKLAKLNSLKTEEVAQVTRELLGQEEFRSITNDNGIEFKSQKKLGCPIYFCDPGMPSQRGTVENTIGVIRRFIKQDTNLEEVNIQALESWLNLRPRKVLDYKTPYEVHYGVNVALEP